MHMLWSGLHLSVAHNSVSEGLAVLILLSFLFDRGRGQTLHDQLHWLDVSDRVLFKLAVTVHQCLTTTAIKQERQ